MATSTPSAADIVDVILGSNEAFAADAELPTGPRPTRHTAVVACMDARIRVVDALGFRDGEAHVIRNAGGIVTDDTIRSLILSQRRLDTWAIVLVHHTDCGLLHMDEAELLDELEAETGERPPMTFGSFTDPAESLRLSAQRLRSNPWLPHREAIIGFVYDVDSGLLERVELTAL